MSHSPAAQLRQGSGSGRRTMPTTRSPGAKPEPAGASSTSPSDSWPIARRSSPGGAQPYSPAMISMSVPQTPTALVFTRTGPSSSGGSGSSVRSTVFAFSGTTVTARMLRPYTSDDGAMTTVPGLAQGKLLVATPRLADPN